MDVNQIIRATLSSSFLFIGLAQANSVPNFSYISQNLSISGALGYLHGESREYVYDADVASKISQLNWHIDGSAVLGAEANLHLFSIFDANFRGWSTLDNGSATLDDYDWMVPNQVMWTDWSHHEDTDLRSANEWDVSLRGWFWQRPKYQLGGILGYQRSLFSFLAKGGCFNYNSGAFTGCFPDGEIGIGYQQTFSTPYIGVAGKYFTPLFEIDGIFKFSNLVHAKDIDQHFQRDLTFRENGQDFDFYQASITAGYNVRSHLQLFAQGTLEYYKNDLADTFIVDNITGQSAFLPTGSAGLENTNYVISIGLKYTGDDVVVDKYTK